MRNVDKIKKQYVHLFVALRRKKDNPELKDICFREIDLYDDSYQTLLSRIKKVEGTWRIHKTINKRDTHKALKLLQHEIIEKGQEVAESLPSMWKTCLMKKEAKAERNILLDIDSEEAYNKVTIILDKNNTEIVEETPSVTGHHIVIDATKVDTRLFEGIEDLTFQRDGYVFIEQVEGSK
jgi:hypothetical protein